MLSDNINVNKPLSASTHPMHAALSDKVTAEILTPVIHVCLRIVHSVPAVNHTISTSCQYFTLNISANESATKVQHLNYFNDTWWGWASE